MAAFQFFSSNCQLIFFTTLLKILECKVLRLVPRNANLIGERCQKLCDLPVWSNPILYKWRAEASYPSSNQNFCKCRASFNNFSWKNVFHKEIIRTKLARKCKYFRFLMRIKPFVLQNYWLRFVQQGIERHFLLPKKSPDGQKRASNDNLRARTGQKMNISFDSSRYSNSVFLNAATVKTSSAKISINIFVFSKDDSITMSPFVIPSLKIW